MHAVERVERVAPWVVGVAASIVVVLVAAVAIGFFRSDDPTVVLSDPPPTETAGPADCAALGNQTADRLLDVVEATDTSLFDTEGLAVPPAVAEQLQAEAERFAQSGCEMDPQRPFIATRLVEQALVRFPNDQRRISIVGFLAAVVGGWTTDGPTHLPTPATAEPLPILPTPGAMPTVNPVPSSGETEVAVAGGGFRVDTTWCRTRGFVGAVVTSDGDLEAVCADGERRVIEDSGLEWQSVTVGHDRVVASASGTDGPSLHAFPFASAGGAPEPMAPGALPVIGPSGATAWYSERAQAIHVRGPIGDGPGDTADFPLDLEPVDIGLDRSGRFLIVTVEVEGDQRPSGVRQVLVRDRYDPEADWAPVSADPDVLLAGAGEVDTPSNAVLLLARDGSVEIDATFLHEDDSPSPFGLADTALPSGTFTQGRPFVVAAGLLGYDPTDTEQPWRQTNGIGWFAGDGAHLYYVPGTGDPVLVADGVADFALHPAN